MKVLFITDNFPPEVNAPATRTFEHCKEWVKMGAEVTVITCFPNFPQGKVYKGYRNKLYSTENMDGIRIIRVWSYITANEGFMKRTLDYISFAIGAVMAALFQRLDVIIATSPQFFTAPAASFAALVKRKPWIMEVRDLWPESIRTVGAMKRGRVLNWLEKIELRMYRDAAKIVVVTESFKANLVSRGIHADKIDIVKNGVNFDLFRPLEKDQQLVRDLGISGKFVLGYTGTHGMAHKLEFILECAAKLDGAYPFCFVFLGDGAEKEQLKKISADLQLKNVLFIDPVSKFDMPRYLSVVDLALVPLKRSDTFRKVIPSKIFEISAMHIPIFLGVEGEAKALVEQYDAGFCFEPENRDSFIRQLLWYYNGRDKLKSRFAAGCASLAGDFDRKRLARKMFDSIAEVNDREK